MDKPRTNVLAMVRLINEARAAHGQPEVSSDELDGIFATVHDALGMPPAVGDSIERIATIADDLNALPWFVVLTLFHLLFDIDGSPTHQETP